MPRRGWIALLSVWPGLPQIWSGQEVLGLLLGAFFAATLNLAVLGRYVWTDALPAGSTTFLTAVAALAWAASLAYTIWWLWRCHPERYKAEIDRLYREAMEHYLRGRWNEARRHYEQILARDEADADALLQLGTLYLRADRPDLARKAFRQCLDLDGGAKWRWEIDRALRRVGG